MWLQGYVEVKRIFDAEHCPDPLPAGFDGCMVYAGGSSAAHAWDDAELARVAHLPRLPVWVPTPGHEDPVAVADEFLTWLVNHSVPHQAQVTDTPVHVMWDMETGQEPDRVWLDRAADHMAKAGISNLVYGSTSTLFGQPERDGYIVANPTGQPHLFPRSGVKGTQYAFDVATPGGQVDESVITVDLLGQLWLPGRA